MPRVAAQARWLNPMLKVARLQDRIPSAAELHRFILCTWRSIGTALEGGGCDQSIGSTVSDVILRSCCGRLQVGVPHWATSVDYCKQLIIDPTCCGGRFSTGRLLAIEDTDYVSFLYDTSNFSQAKLFSAAMESPLHLAANC